MEHWMGPLTCPLQAKGSIVRTNLCLVSMETNKENEEPSGRHDLLFIKLGHPLSEIRGRALQIIVSKKKSGIIEACDLKNRTFLSSIHGWFCYEPRDTEADSKFLVLLVELSKDAEFASKLLAASFDKKLERLAAETDGQVRAAADALLSSLLRLPFVEQAHHAAGSMSQPCGAREGEQGGPSHSQGRLQSAGEHSHSMGLPGGPSAGENARGKLTRLDEISSTPSWLGPIHGPDALNCLPSGGLVRGIPSGESPSTCLPSRGLPCGAPQGPEEVSCLPSGGLRCGGPSQWQNQGQAAAAHTGPGRLQKEGGTREEKSWGPGPPEERLLRAQGRIRDREAKWERNPSEIHESLCDLGHCLPCVTLGAGDEQRLFDINIRLQYSDTPLIVLEALQELHEEVMRDVAPEALLQWPHHLANLFSLLRPADVASPLPQAVLGFLKDLIDSLRNSQQLARDPALLPPPANDEAQGPRWWQLGDVPLASYPSGACVLPSVAPEAPRDAFLRDPSLLPVSGTTEHCVSLSAFSCLVLDHVAECLADVRLLPTAHALIQAVLPFLEVQALPRGPVVSRERLLSWLHSFDRALYVLWA
eukprot:jgi/Botrbrau1/7667/Bobra.0159s0109.1